MNEQDLYRELVAWLKSHHPLVLAQWESQRKRREQQADSERRLLQEPAGQRASALDRLSPDANAAAVTNAIRQELAKLGVTGGTPGVTLDGTPCIHLIKEGMYGSAYEESVTLARVRDPGYRRHLRDVFG